MAFIQIKSNNKDLSYILEKNPSTGLQAKKSNKKGVFFFWFSNENSVFNIYFKDPSEQISYTKNVYEKFEYLSASKYNNARILNDAISDILHSTREKDSEYDKTGFSYLVNINLLETQFKTIDIFQRYFIPEGFKIEYKVISINNYNLVFSTSEHTLRKLINLVNLFGIIAALNSEDFNFLTDDLVLKYARISAYLDAPYFIRYLLKVKMMRSMSKFNICKSLLEQSNKFTYNIMYGDSHDMRIKWVKENLILDHNLLDVGTGKDHKYLNIFAQPLKQKGLKYYAIETDEDARYSIARYIKYKNLEETVELFESLEHFLIYYKAEPSKLNILCTEVLEHNELSEAKNIVKEFLKLDYNKILITVPNQEFNQFYGLDEFRHEDHKWEITSEQFKIEFKNIIKNTYYDLVGVGDTVNNIFISTGLIIAKNEEILKITNSNEILYEENKLIS